MTDSSKPIRLSSRPVRFRCRTCRGSRRGWGGNTGYQIAKELSATHEVHLAIGSRQKPLPQRLLGRDLFWWLTKTGLIKKTVDSRIGRRLQGKDTLIGSSPRELGRRYRINMKPRVVAAAGRT